MSWQTRTISQYIAATVQVEKGKTNPLAEAAQKIALDDDELSEIEKAEKKKPAVKENAPGSYEKFMARAQVR